MKKIVMVIAIAIVLFGVYKFFNYGVTITQRDNAAMLQWRYEHAVRP